MFKPIFLLAFCFCAILGCKKSENSSPKDPPKNPTEKDLKQIAGTLEQNFFQQGGNTDTFITYLIRAGNNFCDNNSYPTAALTSLKFKALFDSSCIYATVDPNNQADINKLYGFADSNTFHQTNSARFGWNWMNGEMHIHAYCYVSTVRMYKELGTVPLNTEIDCRLDVLPGKYIFTLNGKSDTMLRASQEVVAKGYKLYPYFGGDEPAPHDIKIKVKEIN
ncbi:MAG TPA: hypothetical protein PL009_04370 [Flavipsychrobacter sp.]|nr:hypothetical protein [Flavipsychrobacter sp.]